MTENKETAELSLICQTLRDFKITVVIVAGTIGAVFAVYISYFHGGIDTTNTAGTSWQTFGTYFGGTLGPILSFFAIFAALVTLNLQMKQLRDQQKVIAQQRKEFHETQKSFELQNFEKTFFEMLHLFEGVVNGLSSGGEKTGRECFQDFAQVLEGYYKEEAGDKTDPVQYGDYLRRSFEKFAEIHEPKIGHYFRLLYRIYKFVHESDPDGKIGIKKKHYTGIIRSLLSSYELVLLFYDCFYRKGVKFADLVIEYSVFENMQYTGTLFDDNHIYLFDGRAYGDDWETLKKKLPHNFPVKFRGKDAKD